MLRWIGHFSIADGKPFRRRDLARKPCMTLGTAIISTGRHPAVCRESAPRPIYVRQPEHAKRASHMALDDLSREPTIVLTTLGTLGDLYPFIAIAFALKIRGFRPILAVAQDHLAVCHDLGLEAIAIHAGFQAIGERMGLSDREAIRRIVADQRVMLEQVLLDDLPACAAKLDEICKNAEAIVGSVFVFAAGMIAEKRGLPLISIVLQPMAMLRAEDPPQTPDFWMMVAHPRGRMAKAWNRVAFCALRTILNLLYGRRIDAVRGALALPPAGASHMLDAPPGSILRLGCYSPLFAAAPAQCEVPTRIVGFPMFDGALPTANALPSGLAAFLAAGPPPLVFSLGTFVVGEAEAFYINASVIARRLGMRAVLLTGDGAAPQSDGRVFRCTHASHSQLFPAAAVIIHHGGVGTTGQALRAGKPQLVVPHMGDQHDHGHRIEHLGVGIRLLPRHFTVERGIAAIRTLATKPDYASRAVDIAIEVARESGAAAAAAEIERVLTARDDAPPVSDTACDPSNAESMKMGAS